MPHYIVRWTAVQPGGSKNSNAWQGAAADDWEAKNAARAHAQQNFPKAVNILIDSLTKR